MSDGHEAEHHTDHNPADILIGQHDFVMQHVATLRETAEEVQVSGFSTFAFRKIADIIRILDFELRHHNDAEERFVFPVLAKRSEKLVETLLDEHKEMWDAFVNLLESIRSIEEGSVRGISVTSLLLDIRLLCDLLTSHIQKENDLFFPTLRDLLPQEELVRIYNEMKETTDSAHKQ
jgi:hemerythrin-like domain-containing protein